MRRASPAVTAWYDPRMICRFSAVMARRLLACVFVLLGAGCTTQQVLMSALVPDGAGSMLLSHLQSVEGGNRRRIIELEQQGDWQGLAQFAETNIAKDPYSTEWQMIGGYAHLQLRDYPRAITYFSEMVRLSPDEASGYHFLAEAQRAAGRPQRAVTTLERALLVVRESPLTYQLLGAVYADLAQHRAAAEAYRRALAIDARLAEAWFGLGRASLQLGRAEDAQEALRTLEQMQSPRGAQLRGLLEGKR